MTQSSDRRRNGRFLTQFEALLSNGRDEGTGILVDISLRGAAFRDATVTPPLGAVVRAYVFVNPVSPFELSGRVVRREEGGFFAMEYEKLRPEVARLVEDVAALVAVPKRS